MKREAIIVSLSAIILLAACKEQKKPDEQAKQVCITDSLAKIIPYAYIVSAKVATFKAAGNSVEHTSYDFDRCVRLAESLGFKGTYMVAQWGNNTPDIDYEKVAAWVIDHLKANIKA